MPWLWVEWFIFFVAVPWLVARGLPLPVPRIAVMAVPYVYGFIVYVATPRPVAARTSAYPLWKLFLRFLLLAPLLGFFAWWYAPQWLFELPRHRPLVWGVILIVYPLLSALPQEFLYRRFYFWRYRGLFGRGWLMTGSSVLVFAFMHIVYANWVAVALTLVGGILFTRTYVKSGRLLHVWLEHSLYGNWIFTVGLGRFFYGAVR